MRRYFSTAAQQRKYEEFTSLKQGNMTVMDYRDKFTQLSRFAPTMVATEEERCRRFEWGLNLNIRAAQTTMAHDNFDDFVSAAIRAEDVERERQLLSRTHRYDEGGSSQGPSKRSGSGSSGSASSSSGSGHYRSSAHRGRS